MKNVYLLIEDDDSYDMAYRVFKTLGAAETAFKTLLHEHFNINGYNADDFDEAGRTFDQCVEAGSFIEDGYYLTIVEKEVEG